MMSRRKIKKFLQDPIEDYLDHFSSLDLKSEEDTKISSVLDILFGFLFHLLFLMIFGIFYFQSLDSKPSECQSPAITYWTRLIIFYHFNGAICCLIVIPTTSFLDKTFPIFNRSFKNFTSFLRVMLAISSLAIFWLILIKYEWENKCQTMNDLFYIYLLLCGTCYFVFLLFGGCLLFANFLGKRQNINNQSNLNINNSFMA